MIKAVLYDLGDIFFEAHYWREWMWKYFVEKYNYNGSFRDFYELYEEYLDPVYKGQKKYWKSYEDFLDYFGVKNKNEFINFSKNKKKYYEDTRSLYDGVKKTLKELNRRKILNIVISDNESGSEFVRNNILKKFGINKSIDKVITSSEVGVKKPDSKIFNFALETYNLKKDNIIFVGHDRDEINGAVNNGIYTIEFNNYLGYETKANLKIDDFSDILGSINQ